MIAVDPSSAEALAVTGTSAPFTTTLISEDIYIYTCTVGSYIAQAASSPVASAASGSMYVPGNTLVTLTGRAGAKLAAIHLGSDGTATLCRAVRV